MTKPARNNSLRKAGLLALLLAAPLPFSMSGCTDLTETPQSAITPENFYRTDVEVLGGLASVYSSLRATVDNYYNLNEISTDEIVIPTRGQDWYDNGKWLELHRHTWEAGSALGGDDINGAWNNASIGIARANVVLNAIENVSIANKPAIVAELRVLRAFYYYQMMDLFGGVPLVTTTVVETHPRATRAETFAFIETELKESRSALPATRPTADYGRVTQGVVDALLASMYLNAEVFTGTVTAAGLQKGAPRWNDAVTTADLLLNSPNYSLQPAGQWRKNFTPDNDVQHPEIIFAVRFLAETDLGLNFVMRLAHYNQFTPTPWNGFATMASTYNSFDTNDERKAIFLEGPQNNLETGLPANDRAGARLVFTDSILDVTQATEGEGPRILKWPVDPDHVAQNNGNDFAWFRISEIYLIKAEAQNELGNTAAAVALINQVHTLRNPTPVVAATQQAVRDAILKERLLELIAEGKRRPDMIRLGKFLLPFPYKSATTAPYRILFPIPTPQIQTNSQLTQNAGY
jgi:hypothetical protein